MKTLLDKPDSTARAGSVKADDGNYSDNTAWEHQIEDIVKRLTPHYQHNRDEVPAKWLSSVVVRHRLDSDVRFLLL